MQALDQDIELMLIAGIVMFVVGLVLCARRTRFGRQIAQPITRIWNRELQVDEAFILVKLDGLKMLGIGLMGVGYLMAGTVLLFVVPGWGLLVFIVGFVVAASLALWRAR